MLNPEHEDSRYYLANCLAALGEFNEALNELDTLRRISPHSHRAHKQWGVLRAVTARTEADLEAAEQALERSLEINQEETGSLLVLGEIALLQGEGPVADERFKLACQTNPKAVGGFYLRAYIAWTEGRTRDANALLEAAVKARGPEWKPEGAVAEGDVAARMHRETTPLSHYWESWDGSVEPETAFGALEARLARR